MATPFAQIQEFFDSHQGDMTSGINERPQDGVTLTNKRLPTYRLYHLTKFNNEGQVIDYHEDYFSSDVNGMFRRLQRRYTNGANKGKPVWVTKLPEGATTPEKGVLCTYPGCDWTGSSPDHLRLHLQAYHSTFARDIEDQDRRSEREMELQSMREQSEAIKLLVTSLAKMLESQGNVKSAEVANQIKNVVEAANEPRNVGWRAQKKKGDDNAGVE